MTTEDIERFCDEWPGAAHGPAHVVLDDYNMDDSTVRWCLGLIDAVLGNVVPSSEDRALLDRLNWYRGDDYIVEHSRDELEATRGLLLELLTIPEDDRPMCSCGCGEE